jgi:hypothetical protein
VTPEDGVTRDEHDRTPRPAPHPSRARSLCSLAPQDDGAVRDRRRRGHDLSQLFRAGRRRLRSPDCAACASGGDVPIGAKLRSSLPGLTRQSIDLRKNFLTNKMDARVKPAHDELAKQLN